jgi:type I restriction enzyme, S subunit
MSNLVSEGWEVKRLGELCNSVRGVSYKPNDLYSIKSDSTATLLRSNNIQSGQLILNDVQFVDRKKVKERQIARAGDIVICMSNGSKRLVGKNGIFRQTYQSDILTVGAFCSIIRTKESGNENFISQVLKSDEFFKQVGFSLAGSAINNLKDSDVEDYLFSFPPITEQKKIASILTSVDEVIDNTQKQIDKLQDLKKATMNELLTKGIGHTEFKDSEFGKIPKNWECYELGQLCTFTQGVQISLDETLRKNREGYIRYLYINDFSSERNLRFIKDEFPTKIVKDKELVMANTGHSAGTIFRGKHGVLSNNAFKISIKKNIESEYLFHFLSTDTYWFNIGKLFNTAGQPHVGHSNIAKLQFFCPPLDEQEKIISIIQKIDQNIFDKNRKVSKIQSIKKSLMQDLLTGKVRVKVN